MSSCSLIIIDNFYKNVDEVREFALKQNFSVTGNYPGNRTISYANEAIKSEIQKFIEPFGGKITSFPIETNSYNGAFQYTTSRERSWVHIDSYNNWAGVLYLTPNAPLDSGTSFYKIKDNSMLNDISVKEYADKFSQDLTKWDKVDKVGNVFNRLILFNSKRYHMSDNYFGNEKNDSRLFQTFFFSAEK